MEKDKFLLLSHLTVIFTEVKNYIKRCIGAVESKIAETDAELKTLKHSSVRLVVKNYDEATNTLELTNVQHTEEEIAEGSETDMD